MNKVLLCIGSNTNALLNLNRAINKLQLNFKGTQFTETAESNPYGAIYKRSFLNTLAYFETNMNKNELVLSLKSIEIEMGRHPEHKAKGKVIIDIDLIKWNDEIVKPEDFKRSYVRNLLEFLPK
ncbi:MAG: 2-amino-4-hydroxy-6-hydroxymethyldihydropteridine diphosphokinase [Dysgonamonadaceae bacterium]|nr:2-amino-4-hydroxy-6-hydroxymethyldihydropteridine diphosphokinase [Dysgonamonadaceae bacterium]MDD4727504.1 2-amino-4-hydroxy-6-hydroxymethyldihydropteridine diphosphokinase [Dysgonamonadaceae bacterium]